MRKTSKRKGFVCLVGVLCTLLMGCVAKDYSDTATELLKAASEGAFQRCGMESEVRLISIDISDFTSFPIDAYEEWAKEQHEREDCFVFITKDGTLPFAENEDILTFLMEQGYPADVTWDWTHSRIEWMKGKDTLSKTEMIQIHFNYMSINQIEGWELKMKYQNGIWVIEKADSTYMS